MQTMTTRELYEAAMLGYERQRSEIAMKMVQLQQMLATPEPPEREQHAHRKRHFSLASRRKMSQAQKRRWALIAR